MFPLLVDLTGRQVLVVGGGPVGRRRADAMLGAGATVRILCREPRPADVDILIDWQTGMYHTDHLHRIALVFAAGPPDVNAHVVADARALGIWVNSAAGPPGDVMLPAVVRRGSLTLAISTGGAAPALARAIRTRLETQFDDVFADWLRLLTALRPLVRQRHEDEAARRLLWERLCRWDWVERWRVEGEEAVRVALLAEVEAG